MKKTNIRYNKIENKNCKGITLVALIITIIALLIIAAVSIGVMRENGIINHAQNAKITYDNKQTEEKGVVEGYETFIDKHNEADIWKMQEDGETIKNEQIGKTIKIGDAITNNEVLKLTGGEQKEYNGTWTVLGVEDGRLKLVSTSNVVENVILGYEDNKAKEANPLVDGQQLTDAIKFQRSIWSYQHVKETLDEYAQQETGIKGARCITIEDLESKEILNITDEKKKLNDIEYGKTYKYAYNEGKTGTFVDKDGKKVVLDSSGKEVELDYNYYTYSQAFKGTKFANSLGSGIYWLSSSCVSCFANFAFFNIRYIYYGDISTCNLFNSNGGVLNNNPIRSSCYSIYINKKNYVINIKNRYIFKLYICFYYAIVKN